LRRGSNVSRRFVALNNRKKTIGKGRETAIHCVRRAVKSVANKGSGGRKESIEERLGLEDSAKAAFKLRVRRSVGKD